MISEQRNGMVQAVLEKDEAEGPYGGWIRRSQPGGWETSLEAFQARDGGG